MKRARTLISMEVTDENGSRSFCKKALDHIKIASTVLLYGNLGSGKTFLTREFVKALDLVVDVSSPSFALINQYQGDPPVNHIDLYRIDNVHDIDNLGLEELLNSDALNFIEWPQLIEARITWPHYRIYIKTDDQNEKWRRFVLGYHNG